VVDDFKFVVNYVKWMVDEFQHLVIIFMNYPPNIINHIFQLNQPFKFIVEFLQQISFFLYQKHRYQTIEIILQAELLMTVHHKNLVSFIGYCDEGDKMALIYEFMANGNLKENLSGRSHHDLDHCT